MQSTYITCPGSKTLIGSSTKNVWTIKPEQKKINNSRQVDTHSAFKSQKQMFKIAAKSTDSFLALRSSINKHQV